MENDLSYTGWEASLRLFLYPWPELELSPFVTYHQENYDGPATVLDTDNRRDRQWRTGASLTWNFKSDQALEAGYQYVANDSNSALHDYQQHMVNMGMVWKF